MSKSQTFSPKPDTTELTAYFGGPAVVRESRSVDLTAGKTSLILGGLPSQLIPGTHTVVSIDGAGKLKLHNITHRQPNLNLMAVLKASIGKQITVAEGIFDEADEAHGELVAVLDGNRLVLKTGPGEEHTIVPFTNNVSFPEGLPEGLSSTPSVAMNVEVTADGAYVMKSLYESEGLSWSPVYEAFLDTKSGKLSRFACYVALVNGSGADFTDAGFKLIGAYNQQSRRKGGGMRAMSAAPEMASFDAAGGGLEAAAVASESVGEHKLYILPEPITIANGETVNSILVFATDVPVVHEYHMQAGYYNDGKGIDVAEMPKTPVQVTLKLQNNTDSKLGMALPPGEVRVLEADSAGQMQKTDTTHVRGPVSPNEHFQLAMGNPARDLKGVRVLMSFQEDPPHTPELRKKAQADDTVVLPPRFREEDREVTLYNYGDTAAVVCVHENFYDNTEIKWASYPVDSSWSPNESGARCFVTVPPTGGDKPGRASFRYVARWKVE